MLKRKAFALSIIFWVVAALLFGIASLAILSKDTLFLSTGIKEKLSSELIAQDMLEILKFYIMTAEVNNNSFKNNSFKNINYQFPSQLIVDNRWYFIKKNIKIRLHDTSALINIFYPNSKLLSALASTQQQEKYLIADSIQDWIDTDNIVSLNGAEQSRYDIHQNIYYKIRNSPALQSVEELRLIMGIRSLSKKKWNILKKYLYYGKPTKINLTLINSKYLALLLKINESQAESYIKERSHNLRKFISLINEERYYIEEDMGFYLSKQLKIEIEVLQGNSKSILKTTINFKKNKNMLYTTIFYELK